VYLGTDGRVDMKHIYGTTPLNERARLGKGVKVLFYLPLFFFFVFFFFLVLYHIFSDLIIILNFGMVKSQSNRKKRNNSVMS
jgi:hypothetical protein